MKNQQNFMVLSNIMFNFGSISMYFVDLTQNFGFTWTSSKFWNSELRNGESWKSQYHNYLLSII